MKYPSSYPTPHFKQSWLCTNTVLKCSFCLQSFLSTGPSFQTLIWLEKHLYHAHRSPSVLQFKEPLKKNCCFTLWLFCYTLLVFIVKNPWLTINSFLQKTNKKKKFMCAWRYFVFWYIYTDVFYILLMVYCLQYNFITFNNSHFPWLV